MTIVSSGQVLSGTTFSGAFLMVESGGSVVNTTVAAGFLQTEPGGSATNTNVTGSAFDQVGGTDTGATVQSGAFLEVQSGGTAISSVVVPGSFAQVFSGGTAVAPIVQSGSTLAVSSGGQVQNANLAPGATLDLGSLVFASGGTASINTSTDVLTVTEGAATTTLQLQGNYAGDSFTLSSFPEFLPGVAGFASGTAITEVSGNILVPAAGTQVGVTTTTAIQTALAQQIVALAAQTPGSQTVYIPNQSQVTSATTLASPVFIDLPERHDTITGTAAVPNAHVLLANPGASYVTGGTAISTVVAADGAPATIINNGPGDALLAATGAAGNTLEGLAGANQFITGTGGSDAVLLDGAANALASNGADAVLVGGASTVTQMAGGLDNMLMTAGTTLAFIDQAGGAAPNTVTGAANAVVVVAGAGSTVINAGAGPESVLVDTSAGNVTLNGGLAGGDAFTFIKDANAASARVVVTNFATNDTLAVHGYAGFNVQANAAGAGVLSLSDGSQVTFTNLSAAAVQQAVRLV